MINYKKVVYKGKDLFLESHHIIKLSKSDSYTGWGISIFTDSIYTAQWEDKGRYAITQFGTFTWNLGSYYAYLPANQFHFDPEQLCLK